MDILYTITLLPDAVTLLKFNVNVIKDKAATISLDRGDEENEDRQVQETDDEDDGNYSSDLDSLAKIASKAFICEWATKADNFVQDNILTLDKEGHITIDSSDDYFVIIGPRMTLVNKKPELLPRVV